MRKIVSVVLCIITMLTVSTVGAGATSVQAQAKSDITIPIVDFLGEITPHMGSGINDITVRFVETDRENILQMKAEFYLNDGTPGELMVPFYYDTENGVVFGKDYTKGFFESGFNYFVDGKVFVAPNNCWQRQFGFTPVYDFFANLGLMDYLTCRVYFEYDGTDWMVQMWKGNYFFDILAGGEIGIYYKPDNALTLGFYLCGEDEHMMNMTLRVYDENKVYVDLDEYLTWWATGFVLSGGKVNKCNLVLESTLEFPNAEMCEAFAQSARNKNKLEVSTDGNVAKIKW